MDFTKILHESYLVKIHYVGLNKYKVQKYV